MLARTLQRLVREGLTNAREIGELAGVSTSTAYRWIAGDSEPDFNSIRLLIRHLKNADATEALLAIVTTGTSYRFRRCELDADVNQDGKINADDALDAAINTVHAAGETLTNVRESLADNDIDHDEAVKLMAILNDVVLQSALVEEVLMHMLDNHKPRRKCATPRQPA